jgi:hypothetical protein
MTSQFKGRGFIPGGYGDVTFAAVSRAEVEYLLRSWFAWLADSSRIHVRPCRSVIEAELQIRRWKAKPDLVFFRWRNSASTREVFDRVLAVFQVERPEVTIELTPKTRKPRALTLSTRADDILAPSWAMGLVGSAFRHAGVGAVSCFDLSTMAHALPIGRTSIPLEPLSRAFVIGNRVGRAARRLLDAR